MLKTYDLKAEISISFDDFIKTIEDNNGIDTEDSQEACAIALSKLYLNRTFLYDFLAKYIKDNLEKPKPNHYTPQSFILHQGKNFYVRANYWYGQDKLKTKAEALLYAYDTPHDHSFNFLTINYEGPGYETEVWEYDYELAGRYIGEDIPLKNRCKHRIEPGKIHLYRKSKDVHAQYPPKSTTITINVISTTDRFDGTNQLYFEVNKKRDSGKINNFPQTHSQTSHALLSMYNHFHDDKSLKLLKNIAISSTLRRSRVFALDFLKKNSQYSMKQIFESIPKGNDAFVLIHAKRLCE